MHIKRNNMKGFWPIEKKGTKYLAVPTHNQSESVPLVIAMRDVLKLVKSKKELKKVLNEKQIRINDKEIREVNFPVSLFDVLSIPRMKKNYRVLLSKHKKFVFGEISNKEAETKIYKIIGKKMLPGKSIQLNLAHGRNIIFKEKANIGDSAVFNFKENKIVRIIPLEKGGKIFIVKGKHAGYFGKIDDIVERGGRKIAKVISDKEKINVWVKNLIVVE